MKILLKSVNIKSFHYFSILFLCLMWELSLFKHFVQLLLCDKSEFKLNTNRMQALIPMQVVLLILNETKAEHFLLKSKTLKETVWKVRLQVSVHYIHFTHSLHISLARYFIILTWIQREIHFIVIFSAPLDFHIDAETKVSWQALQNYQFIAF